MNKKETIQLIKKIIFVLLVPIVLTLIWEFINAKILRRWYPPIHHTPLWIGGIFIGCLGLFISFLITYILLRITYYLEKKGVYTRRIVPKILFVLFFIPLIIMLISSLISGWEVFLYFMVAALISIILSFVLYFYQIIMSEDESWEYFLIIAGTIFYGVSLGWITLALASMGV